METAEEDLKFLIASDEKKESKIENFNRVAGN